MTTKERLHQLVDQLQESSWSAAERVLSDPLVLALLDTPDGEPPLSAKEIAGILEAKKDVAAGRVRRFSNVEDLIADLHSNARR